MNGSEPAGQLVPLDEAECWELVRSSPVGRLAWEADGEINVIPVNFDVADGPTIRIHTSPYSAMALECADRRVAFEVDRIDTEHHGGWSVLLHGRCTHEGRASADGPEPWAAGARMLGLAVAVSSVSGRRVVGSV